ncbi:MAG: HlyC/CorC family transporter [Rhodospirillaceae bacterium]|jgi:magnesium and cobalt transporter|nr:HlyC/CorC family transporter [Rhodospirillales bacterium]MBT3904738.1 HlyC/CorC family transporter [Rhodospirillaceae bacterium]MBT4701656.1 HlyC/CorC family transporter [Rhodospirillaceae bacterium]MBT5035210.1 HlyC/CorC family transporter [Rhodospirillaceae bacterium]MBT6220694.1 HlyC/CorC family transporter [Rhodospirillaceae bacterium]
MNNPTSSGPVNQSTSNQGGRSVGDWLRRVLGLRNGESTVRDTLEELIEEREEAEAPIDAEEKVLLANILELRGQTVFDVMVPRVDITAVDVQSSLAELISVMTKEAHSRVPIYRDNLDHVTGMVHIKDVLAWRGEDAAFSLPKILRKVLFVSPSMQVLELLLEMRAKRTHMAMVVDEYGGVDGLVTIEDLVEEIVGEIEDEHDQTEEPELVQRPDGSFDADARAVLEELQDVLKPIMGEEEWEDSQTLGGLVVDLAGRVPIRGELITHSSGIEFQILDADPRRLKRVRVRGAKQESQSEPED